MIKDLFHQYIAKFEARYNYDSKYMHEILDQAGVSAFLRFAPVQGLSSYCSGISLEAWFAARLKAMLREDCGPCTQLTINMATEAGISPSVLQAVIKGQLHNLSSDTSLAVRFVDAALNRDIEADSLREEVVQRFGAKGLVTLAYSITAARLYPTLKYALGHGQACTILEIDKELVTRDVVPQS